MFSHDIKSLIGLINLVVEWNQQLDQAMIIYEIKDVFNIIITEKFKKAFYKKPNIHCRENSQKARGQIVCFL